MSKAIFACQSCLAPNVGVLCGTNALGRCCIGAFLIHDQVLLFGCLLQVVHWTGALPDLRVGAVVEIEREKT